MRPYLLVCLWTVALASGLSSPLAQVPFLIVWNAPTEPCLSIHGVHLDLGIFDIVQNQAQKFMGGNVTIFYENKLGYYPHYTVQGMAINGGVPQNASLKVHLQNAMADILADIPDPDFQGLAVVDWESWRPLWARNWDSKHVYWEGSKMLVRDRHPDWTPAQVENEARKEFEKAAQAFMEDTLKMGRKLRPQGLWGFYGFPGCYNYEYKNSSVNYTGICPPQEMKWNDQLSWLWSVSSALYPDIYLEPVLHGQGGDILRYTRYRVLEALRVAGQVTPVPPPVLPYARIAYTYSLDFLSEEDLVHTIGESAALGAAGVVLWGDAEYAKSKNNCLAVKNYLEGTLGHYLVNVTTAAALCSKVVCSGQGRCQRRHDAPGAYLHLDPDRWNMVKGTELNATRWYSVQMEMDHDHIHNSMIHFDCLCFPGWGGPRCAKKRS